MVVESDYMATSSAAYGTMLGCLISTLGRICIVSAPIHGIMTIESFLSLAEGTVKWINLAFVVLGLALCAYLSPAFLWPDPGDQHGGGISVSWRANSLAGNGKRVLGLARYAVCAAWRWWAQLLPIAMFFGVERLFNTSLGRIGVGIFACDRLCR